MLRQVFLLLAALFVVLDVNAASLRKGAGSEASIHAGGTEQASITTTGDMFLRGSYKTQNENWALNYCDELGANCSTAAELANAVAGQVSPTGQLISGWPDAIKCANGSYEIIMPLSYKQPGIQMNYRFISNPSNAEELRVSYNLDGTYKAQVGMSSYDCVTNTWSIADLYTQDRAFNFTGENVSVGGGAVVSITDIGNVDALTPTDGQVLTWNNTNSKWEATDVAASVSATGQMASGFPDAIKCDSGGNASVLYMTFDYADGSALYRLNENPTNGADKTLYYNADGSYNNHSNLTGYNCVTNTWSIADLYTQNRAFNFTGENVSVGGGAVVSITDIGNVDALTPTDGQVLTWNNTNSKWEASDLTTIQANVSTTTIDLGWPDAIVCKAGGSTRRLRFYYSDATNYTYRYNDSANITFNTSTKAYSTHASMGSYDCVTSTWSIADLYNEGRAFNFIGNNGAQVSLTEIIDVDALTPTDGQVLAWNNTSSKWEASDVAASVSATGQILSGFPDAVKCVNGSVERILHLYIKTATEVRYQKIAYPTDSSTERLDLNLDGSYKAHSGLAGYDCISKSVSTLYSEDKAFNFTGENVSVGGGAVVSITDIGNVDALTPTDGQVLSWNNTNSKWEAQDVAVSVSATGQIEAGFPDAIKCENAGNSQMVYLVYHRANGNAVYRYIVYNAEVVLEYDSSGNYFSNSNLTNVDCVTNAWSISDLYANNRAFNFTGENVSVGGGAVVSITDIGNVDALTPTDGQVLSWNNTNSKWEATDVAVSVSATGQISAGFPDAIRCGLATDYVLYNSFTYSDGKVLYRHSTTPTGTTDLWVRYNSDGSYDTASGFVGYDCVTNTWSIADLYANDRAFNFTGENVSVGGGGLWVDETSYISRTSDVHIVGNLVVTGDVSATEFNVTSDRTKKKNIETLGSALDKVSDLRGVNFEWKEGDKPSGRQVGLIAQEVKEVFPEIVKGEEGGMAVNYSALVAPLIEAVKELKAQNEDLKAENAEFRQRLDKLEQ